jgi:hypothetical protein
VALQKTGSHEAHEGHEELQLLAGHGHRPSGGEHWVIEASARETQACHHAVGLEAIIHYTKVVRIEK